MEGEGVETQAQGGNLELMNNKEDPASTKGSSGKKRKQREFAFPVSDRPARERKSIERFIVSPDKEVKEFKIPKGSGTALKEIPNIVFKLSKRRGGDEVVQTLHKLLFGRTSKHAAKANILQFSGYVWSGNEEKEKAKVKEKLERCVKESLFQISDLLDLSLSKSLKKEDGVLKVFEFLEAPYKTTDKLVVETAKGKKSKKTKKTPVKGSRKKASGKTPRKSPKGAKKTSRKKQVSDEEDESDATDFEDDVEEPEEKSDDDYIKESSSLKKRKRKSPKKELDQESGDEEEILPKKKKPSKEVRKGKGKKESNQEVKKVKKPKEKVEEVEEPSDEDLREAICELLQNADFSKVTFTDVMKQLSQKFNTDLTHRKAQLKTMIHEEIHKLVGEGDNEDEDGNNKGEIDDNGDKANGNAQEEHEDASGDVKADDEEEDGDVKADEEEDGDENAAEGDRDEEDGDEKPDGDDEDEDKNSVEDKADGEDEVEDAKEDKNHDARAEEDSMEMA